MPDTPNFAPMPAARRTLLMLSMLSALSYMDRQILAVLLGPVKAEFGLADLQVGLVASVGFALGFALIALPLGHWADRRDRRTLVAWSRGLGGALAMLGAAAAGAWTLAATRAGGAVSEAGGGPASMSMIADLYPPHQRSSAMSVFSMSASVGSLMALVGGAWLAQHHGWRATLAVVGGSTVVMAVLLRWLVREPARGAFSGGAALAAPALPGLAAVRAIWQQPVARWLIVAGSFALLAGYSFGTWNYTYLVRHHGLSLQGAGAVSGMAAIASVLGSGVAGALTDRLVRRDLRWQVGIPLLGVGLALPAGWIYLLIAPGHLVPAALLVAAFAFFISWWVAPTYAALSLVVPAQRRATANALLLLAGAVLGSGVGPVLTGALSDGLARWVGTDALGWALAGVLGLLALSALGFVRAMARYPSARADGERLATRDPSPHSLDKEAPA
jgi:MFS family permease